MTKFVTFVCTALGSSYSHYYLTRAAMNTVSTFKSN